MKTEQRRMKNCWCRLILGSSLFVLHSSFSSARFRWMDPRSLARRSVTLQLHSDPIHSSGHKPERGKKVVAAARGATHRDLDAIALSNGQETLYLGVNVELVVQA